MVEGCKRLMEDTNYSNNVYPSSSIGIDVKKSIEDCQNLRTVKTKTTLLVINDIEIGIADYKLSEQSDFLPFSTARKLLDV